MLVSDKAESVAQVVTTLRYCERLLTLLSNQRLEVKNSPQLQLALIQAVFTQAVPLPAPPGTAFAEGSFWAGEMRYETQVPGEPALCARMCMVWLAGAAASHQRAGLRVRRRRLRGHPTPPLASRLAGEVVSVARAGAALALAGRRARADHGRHGLSGGRARAHRSLRHALRAVLAPGRWNGGDANLALRKALTLIFASQLSQLSQPRGEPGTRVTCGRVQAWAA
jgi:hypothetical protein